MTAGLKRSITYALMLFMAMLVLVSCVEPAAVPEQPVQSAPQSEQLPSRAEEPVTEEPVPEELDEYAAARAAVAYEGLTDNGIRIFDEEALIAAYLQRLPLLWEDIASLQQLRNEYIVYTAITNTKYYLAEKDEFNPDAYRKELEVLVEPVSAQLGMDFQETWFWIQEHVEQSAKLLFGDDIVFSHQSLKGIPYRYIEEQGVYTPPYTGGADIAMPYILAYTDQGDTYRVEVAYIMSGMVEYYDPDGDYTAYIDEDKLEQHAKTKSRRREMILKKQEDGRVTLVSHRYL